MELSASNSNKKTYIKISILAIVSRVIIYLVGYLGFIMVKGPSRAHLPKFGGMWCKWDGPHYIYIASHWYANHGPARFFLVFYPLYPMFVKLVTFVTGNFFASGLIVSNIFFILSCLLLYKLLLIDFNHETSLFAVVLLIISPFSFFFSGVYSESVFLFFTLSCFYCIRKGNWMGAGIMGFLAALARNFGALLVIPFTIEFLNSINFWERIKKESIKNILKDMIKGLWIILIPVGIFIYLLINKIVSGHWTAFMKYEKIKWKQSFGSLLDQLFKEYHNIFHLGTKSAVSLWMPQLIMFFIAVGLIIYSFRKIRLSYTLYMIAYLIIAYSPTRLLSGCRYLLALFPLYIAISLICKKVSSKMAITFLMGLLLCYFVIAYVTYCPIM